MFYNKNKLTAWNNITMARTIIPVVGGPFHNGVRGNCKNGPTTDQ